MIGAAAAINPIVAALLLIVFGLSVFATKLVAFGSVAISLLYPLFIRSFSGYGMPLAMGVFVTFFVLFAHRHNYRRVQEGKEEKFYFSHYLKPKKAEEEDDDK
jgi:glycerol-3-phosphate acyltransferase PlsY